MPDSRTATASDAAASAAMVSVRDLRKKFCRDLKRSLWYGVKDIAAELAMSRRAEETLRPGEFWAVDGVSFDLNRGECLGLIGHNGAGKTTLLRLLGGIIKPDHGTIAMRGRVGSLIALGAGFNPILTGRENIFVNGAILGMSHREINRHLDDIIDFAELREAIDSPVQGYSSGMSVRLGFAVAAFSRADILLLDEVLSVGDMRFQAKCLNTIADFRKRGTAFILVSHNVYRISRYCDKVLYLRHGKDMYQGPTAEGVEIYQRDMLTNPTADIRTEWGDVWGSGKVVLTGARFRDAGGNTVDSISSGDALDLVIDYECPHGPVSNAVVETTIRQNDVVLLRGNSGAYGVKLGTFPRRGTITLHFDAFPMNGPDAVFSFSVYDCETSEVYDWKMHVRLKVRSVPGMTGLVTIPVGWKVEEAR